MGQLQKRIKELENEFEDLYGDLDLMFGRNQKINLMKIVEEMRQEFPMLTKENEQKWGENWMDELLSARKKWFEKWLK